jgi:hypothetical protein
MFPEGASLEVVSKTVQKSKRNLEHNLKTSDLVERYNLFDANSPYALINMLSDTLKLKFNSQSVQEYIKLGEEEIEKRLVPGTTLRRLRTNFWNTYCTLQDLTLRKEIKRVMCSHSIYKSMSYQRICAGVCHPSFFTDKVMYNDLALAYIFSPPVDYSIMVQENLDLGFRRLKEILSFPVYKNKYDKDGNVTLEPDTAVAEIILKTIAMLDLRVNGPVPKVIHQKVESKNTNLNYNTASADDLDIEIDSGVMELENLDRRIEKIRQETFTMLNDPRYTVKEREYIDDADQKLIEN